MNFDMLIAGAIGLGPALALMYWTLKDYTYPAVEKPFFDDRRIFFMLAVGLVLGAVLFFVEIMFDLSFVLVALLFAVIEELVKLVILNYKSFQRKLDTQFYGLTLGLGMGGTLAFGNVFFVMSDLTGKLDALDYLLLILIAVQFSLLHGSTGATIGAGVARGLPFGYFSQATMVHIAFNLVMIGYFWIGSGLSYLFLAGATGIVAYYYWYVHNRLIPNMVANEVARYRKKARKLNKA